MLNRAIVALISVTVVCIALPSTALSQNLFLDTFDSYIDGATPDAWTVNEASGIAQATSPGQAGTGKRLRVETTVQPGPMLTAGFASQTTEFTVSFWVRQDYGGSGSRLTGFKASSGAPFGAWCLLTSDVPGTQLQWKTYTGGWVTLATRDGGMNTWYYCQMVVDPASQTWDLYIDSTEEATAVPFRDAAATVDEFTIDTDYSGITTTDTSFDDVSIDQGVTPVEDWDLY